MLDKNPFAPQSDHAKALAAKAAQENADLVTRRAAATATEKKNLSGIRGIADGRSSPSRVNPFKIKVLPGFNARIFDTADAMIDDDELVASIKAKGVLHPLTVRIGEDGVTLSLVDGERRLRATIRAINDGTPIINVPVETVPVGMDEADLIASQITHNMGRRYSLLELGVVVKKLLGFGWSHQKIQDETATPIARQKEALEVAALPVEAKEMIKSGAASAKFVRSTLDAAPTPKEGVKRMREAVANATAKGRTRAMPKDLGEAVKPVSDRAFVADLFGSAKSRHRDGMVIVEIPVAGFEELSKRFGLTS